MTQLPFQSNKNELTVIGHISVESDEGKNSDIGDLEVPGYNVSPLRVLALKS